MTSGARVMQIVAHPDDDLFFMNPATVQGLRAGTPNISVYLSAGDADGRNPVRLQEGRATPDKSAYTKARQNGLRAAYGAMALGNPRAPWRCAVLPTIGGYAEAYSLQERPDVTLIFLNIRQHAEEPGPRRQLQRLWADEIEAAVTIAPSGGLVDAEYAYTRDGLVGTLRQLLDLFAPTLVRTLDPDPDRLVHDPERFPQRRDFGDLSDHHDHTAAGLFAWAALEGYQGPESSGRFSVESYRGYANERWPYGLSPQAVSQKEFYLSLYGGVEGWDGGDPAGSGDYHIAFNSRGTGWVQSTTPRYPTTAPWLAPTPEGRLMAFAVVGQQGTAWTETGPGSGAWSGPFRMGGGPLAPGIAPVLASDGRWLLFALRLSELTPSGPQGRELVLREQSAAGKPFHEWVSLGNPSAGGTRSRHLGAPTAVRDGLGRIHVFVRNAGQGISSRVLDPNGAWSDWIDLKGSELQEGLSALASQDGRVEIFGANRGAVHHWSQTGTADPINRGPRFKLTVPGSPPGAALQPDGRVLVAYRRPESVRIMVAEEDAPGGRWSRPAEAVGGRGGFGPVIAAPGPTPEHGTLLLTRSDLGGLAYRFHPQPTPWVELPVPGGTFAHSPAAAYDALGRATLAVIGLDGRLHVTQQLEPGHGGFAPWQPVG